MGTAHPICFFQLFPTPAAAGTAQNIFSFPGTFILLFFLHRGRRRRDITEKLGRNESIEYEPPRLLDEIIEEDFYKKENGQMLIITCVSAISIIISLLGVFGLVFFETEYRQKEIALRRVNGALVGSILWLFNSRFVKVLLVCFVIAVPIATYFVSEWLQEFAYKTPLHLWVYMLAFTIVALFTMLIVVASAWRTVNRNPIEVLNKG